MSTRSTSFTVALAGITVPAVVLLIGIEVLLRLQPSLISQAFLDRFHPRLKGEVAALLNLGTRADFNVIASSERGDKGPELVLDKANQTYFVAADAADREAGSINFRRTDSIGFCNFPGLDPPVDLLVVGGSVPACAGVPAEAVFAAELGRQTGLKTYNMTTGGAGPYEYLEILRRYGPALAPRVVLMAVSEANDIRDILRYLDHRAGRERDNRSIGGPFAVSYSIAFLKSGMEVGVKSLKALFSTNFRYGVAVQGARVPLNVRNGDLDEVRTARLVLEGKVGPEVYGAPMKDFVKLSREHGFLPVVILVPATYTAYRDSIVFEDAALGPQMLHYTDSQREWFLKNADLIGFRFIDITGDMQRAAISRPPLYFPSNVHLTAQGHRVLAEIVADGLRQDRSYSEAVGTLPATNR
jgi:hypothetical protein